MSYNEEDHSAAVGEDYRQALEDLTNISRLEISNLTQIARENTEYAQAISEALQDHIKKVAPQRKLPALYVLDSIVKNVGTPYTLFFGRKLYQTFMEAYASVDNNTRRKMDEMLKTWKEPVPGSIEARPVFAPDVVRPIENALIKARTSALQAQQENFRTQQQFLSRGRAPVPYRETPTPPGVRPGSQQPGPYNQPPYPPPNGGPSQGPVYGQQSYPLHPAQAPPYSTPQPAASAPAAAPYQLPPHGGYGVPASQPALSVNSLTGDIQQLIDVSKADFARNPLDTSIQTRLKALLDLQKLLTSQNLPHDQLMLVKDRVTELAVAVKNQAPNSLTHAPTPPIAVQPYPPPQQVPVAAPVAPNPPASAPPAGVSLDSLFGKGALATLLARQTPTPQASTPYMPPAAVAPIRSPTPQRVEPHKPTAPPPSDPMALLNMLRGAGILRGAPPAGGTPVNVTPVPPPPSAPPPIPPNLASILAAARGVVPPPPPQGGINSIELKASSLKLFRPHLLSLLYEDLGPPCTQCGRRFKTDDEGKKRKTAHMDWHFRVHQRIAEAERRGQHRSWYVDERDWINSREVIDTDHVETSEESNGAAASAASKTPKLKWIPVPDDGTNTVCPICQEKFEMKWLDEAQEWVWMDALRVGNRAYHASCYAEAYKDGGSTPLYSRNTPEPVLGKRKAEDEYSNLRGRIKTDGY